MMQEGLVFHIPARDLARESSFWLRIFRDHSQFLLGALAPDQTNLITQAQQFYQLFDGLLARAGRVSGPFLEEAGRATAQFRAYKMGIVELQLAGQVPVNLPPGALDEMLDEDEEYLRLVKAAPSEQPANEAAFLLHQHLFWLPNQAAHAALLRNQLDPSEAALFEEFDRYHRLFGSLADKAAEIKGLMRGKPRLAPALAQATAESAGLTQAFWRVLVNYREMRASARVLAINPPLLADHLAREAAYYLEKIGYGTPQS